MAIGDYPTRTFQNGVTPVNPTTFQPMEDKVKEVDTGLEDGTILNTVSANIQELITKGLIYGL